MKRTGLVICLLIIFAMAIINNEYEKKAIERCQEGGHDYSYCANIK